MCSHIAATADCSLGRSYYDSSLLRRRSPYRKSILLSRGIPKTIGFNTKIVLVFFIWSTHILGNPIQVCATWCNQGFIILEPLPDTDHLMDFAQLFDRL